MAEVRPRVRMSIFQRRLTGIPFDLTVPLPRNPDLSSKGLYMTFTVSRILSVETRRCFHQVGTHAVGAVVQIELSSSWTFHLSVGILDIPSWSIHSIKSATGMGWGWLAKGSVRCFKV